MADFLRLRPVSRSPSPSHLPPPSESLGQPVSARNGQSECLPPLELPRTHGQSAGPRRYATPLSGHDLMKMFALQRPGIFQEMTAGPTTKFFSQQERDFFARPGKEIIRSCSEGDTPEGTPFSQPWPNSAGPGPQSPSSSSPTKLPLSPAYQRQSAPSPSPRPAVHGALPLLPSSPLPNFRLHPPQGHHSLHSLPPKSHPGQSLHRFQPEIELPPGSPEGERNAVHRHEDLSYEERDLVGVHSQPWSTPREPGLPSLGASPWTTSVVPFSPVRQKRRASSPPPWPVSSLHLPPKQVRLQPGQSCRGVLQSEAELLLGNQEGECDAIHDPDESWCRPTPYKERRRAGKRSRHGH
ncbi:hypothetical protein HGRIS_006554 [Hohenbuehelia grisea]|uniref:Uncharacterized protein n=1 Tax=Hohenbuehelia grisea TaxID=104357 RepID=A0ABR3J9D9_9AGAR